MSRREGTWELTATAVHGKNTKVMTAMIFIELLSAFMILESACVTKLKDFPPSAEFFLFVRPFCTYEVDDILCPLFQTFQA